MLKVLLTSLHQCAVNHYNNKLFIFVTCLCRITTYNESTKPIIEHYKALGKVRRVSAVGTPEEVYNRCFVRFYAFDKLRLIQMDKHTHCRHAALAALQMHVKATCIKELSQTLVYYIIYTSCVVSFRWRKISPTALMMGIELRYFMSDAQKSLISLMPLG